MSNETKTKIAVVTGHFSFYWLDYVIFFAVMSNAFVMIVLAALQGVTWNTLDGQTKFLIKLTIWGNMSGVLVAYFKQVRKRIQAGKDPFEDDTTPPFKPESKV